MINILDENFVLFETELGKLGLAYQERRATQETIISEAIDKLLSDKESLEEGAFYEFMYNPIVESLLTTNFTEAIASTARYIKNAKTLSLEESLEFAQDVNHILNNKADDDRDSIESIFSKEGIDIPENKEDIYSLTINDKGKREALAALNSLQLVGDSLQNTALNIVKAKNFDEVDYLKESLVSLFVLKSLCEGTNETPESMKKFLDKFDKISEPYKFRAHQRESARKYFHDHGGEEAYKASKFASDEEADRFNKHHKFSN